MAESKYGNKKTVGIGLKGEPIVFDSKREAAVWKIRCEAAKAGLIKNLKRQVAIELQPAFKDANGNHHRKITYFADFSYEITKNGRRICEDVKGYVTDVFRLKRKLLAKLIVDKKVPYDDFIETY